MGADTPKLLLQLELPHPSICPPCCLYSQYYLIPCSHDHSSSCLFCRNPCHQRQAVPYSYSLCSDLYRSSYSQHLPCRHSLHSLHETLRQHCCYSSMSDVADASPRAKESKLARACDRHSQADASYFCSNYTRRNAKAAVSDQPMIAVANIGKTTVPADARCGFSCRRLQEKNAAEMRWWEGARKLKGICTGYGFEEADQYWAMEHCYAWPPQAYACTFCRRMFVSAQALGGHMNVHRHERARLRQLPDPYNASAASKKISDHTATTPTPHPYIPLAYNYMNGFKPCFDDHTINPMMISSSTHYDDIYLSSSLQIGLQEATKEAESKEREKLLHERRETRVPINVQMHAHDFFYSQSKQEVSNVDLELRLGHLASH